MNKQYTKQELNDICTHLNERELNAKKAERDSIKYKQIEYLLNKVGHKFDATITGISKWGIYAQINDNHCEGMIKEETLDGRIDKDSYLVNMNDGKTFRLGDTITIKVVKVSLVKKEIDFKII